MKPILIHVHVYYPNLWPELKNCLANIKDYPYQLYVTMVEKHQDIEKDIRENFPNAHIELVDNRGYDIGPFIYILNKVNLDDYSYVIKLHTKRDYTGELSNYVLNGINVGKDRWRKLLLLPFCSVKNFKKALSLLSNKKVGMVGASALIINGDTHNEGITLFEDRLKSLLKEMGLEYTFLSFIGGTMFIAKAPLLKILQKQTFFQFNPSLSVNRDYNDIVYIVERLLGTIIVAQGYKIAGVTCHLEPEYRLPKEKKAKRKKWFGFVKKQKGNKKKLKFYFCGIDFFKKTKTPTQKKIYLFGCQIYHKRIPVTIETSSNQPLQAYSQWLSDLKNNKSLFVPITKTPYRRKKSDAKIFAYYLPQFHAIDINDENYGKGFTEWTNVASALPMYAGHYQPKIPYDVGFYDLTNIKTIQRQVELAKMYGVYGFCFYYYWFNGKKVLEKPIDLFLNSDIDFPFHFCWANENWSKLWDGGDKEVILHQEKHLNADLFFKDILPYIKDKRYEKIDNRPLLMIYNPKMFDKNEMKTFLNDLDRLAIKYGFKGFFFMTSEAFGFSEPLKYGFQGIIEFPPHGIKNITPAPRDIISQDARFSVISLKDYISQKLYLSEEPYTVFKGCFPSWDNTPRKAYSGGCVYEISNEEFASWLSGILEWTKKHNLQNQQYVYINAWNEWAEGAILEPTTRYGYQNLQTVKDCLEDSRKLK